MKNESYDTTKSHKKGFSLSLGKTILEKTRGKAQVDPSVFRVNSPNLTKRKSFDCFDA